MKLEIEKEIEREISMKHVISVQEMIKFVKKVNRVSGMDFEDFFTWFNKEKALIDCLKAMDFQGRACLIDDTVDTSVFTNRNMSISFKHI
jgi:hypothetical protein